MLNIYFDYLLRGHKNFLVWSYRNGQRTVYGDSPVVCFTDIPIAAYLNWCSAPIRDEMKKSVYMQSFT